MFRNKQTETDINEQITGIEKRIEQYKAERDKLIAERSPEFRDDLRRINAVKIKLREKDIDPTERSTLKEIHLALRTHAQEMIELFRECDVRIKQATEELSKVKEAARDDNENLSLEPICDHPKSSKNAGSPRRRRC